MFNVSMSIVYSFTPWSFCHKLVFGENSAFLLPMVKDKNQSVYIYSSYYVNITFCIVSGEGL